MLVCLVMLAIVLRSGCDCDAAREQVKRLVDVGC